VLEEPHAVERLVAVVASRAASDEARTHATAALTNVALRDDAAKQAIIAAKAVPPIVHLAKWGSRKAQEKANVALNILGIESVKDLPAEYHDSDDEGDYSIRKTIARSKKFQKQHTSAEGATAPSPQPPASSSSSPMVALDDLLDADKKKDTSSLPEQ